MPRLFGTIDIQNLTCHDSTKNIFFCLKIHLRVTIFFRVGDPMLFVENTKHRAFLGSETRNINIIHIHFENHIAGLRPFDVPDYNPQLQI